MEVIEKETHQQNAGKEKYPVLKISQKYNFVVLFYEKSKGVVVLPNEDDNHNTTMTLGYHSDQWDDEAFILYRGVIQIRN